MATDGGEAAGREDLGRLDGEQGHHAIGVGQKQADRFAREVERRVENGRRSVLVEAARERDRAQHRRLRPLQPGALEDVLLPVQR